MKTENEGTEGETVPSEGGEGEGTEPQTEGTEREGGEGGESGDVDMVKSESQEG